MPQYRLFVGNLGPQNSMFAQCILDRVNHSKVYEISQNDDIAKEIVYLHIPGLSDNRKTAASEIRRALRQNEKFQIYFVMSISKGKLQHKDLATMQLVLQSTPDISCFGIIINPLSQSDHTSLQNNKNEELKLLEPIEQMKRGCRYEFLLWKNGKDKHSNDQLLDEFFDKNSWIEMNSSNVTDIQEDHDSFQKQLDSQKDLMSVRFSYLLFSYVGLFIGLFGSFALAYNKFAVFII